MGPLRTSRPPVRKARRWPILALALALAPAAPAAAEGPAAPTAVRREDGRRTLHGPPANLGRTAIGVVSPVNLPLFLENTKIESCRYGPDCKVQKTQLSEPPPAPETLLRAGGEAVRRAQGRKQEETEGRQGG